MQDVIVIGGGPAGNNAAFRLSSLGYRVSVIDWRDDLGNKLCSGIVGVACADLYPLDESLIYRRAQSANLFAPNGRPLHFARDDVQAYIIDRVKYVASIAEKAQRAGTTYLLRHRVTAIQPEHDHVAVHSLDGSHRHLHKARTIVVASGFGAALTRPLGLGFVKDYVTGVQAEVSMSEVNEVEVYLGSQVAPGFFAWLVPTTSDRALVGLLSRHQALAHLERLLARLRTEGKIGELVKEPRQWGVPLRPLARTFSDRLVVVGDAAGQTKPTTGGGIFYALVTGDLAAETLHEAFQSNDFSAERLAAYEHRWKGLLQRELDVGYAARRLFEQLRDGQLNFLMRTVGHSRLHHDLVSLPAAAFDWHSGAVTKLLKHPIVGGLLRLFHPLGCPADPRTRRTRGARQQAGLCYSRMACRLTSIRRESTPRP